jgi:hypothetical protein
VGYQVYDPPLRPREFPEKSRGELEKIIGGVGEIPASNPESPDHWPSWATAAEKPRVE